MPKRKGTRAAARTPSPVPSTKSGEEDNVRVFEEDTYEVPPTPDDACPSEGDQEGQKKKRKPPLVLDRSKEVPQSGTSELPHSLVLLINVSSVQPYGVFVKLYGISRDGLVHISQMSKTRVENPGDVSSKGDQVYVKIISMEDDGSKIGLSMKAVNQDNGKDLDPNNVQLTLDEQKKKAPRDHRDKRITLGAVLDTTCKKCGGKGHIAQDCFHVPGGTKYELVPDVDEEEQEAPDKEHKHKKKKKKQHKHKKESKKHKHSDTDDDQQQSPKKKHKHKHRHSSSSSDDESDRRSKSHKHKKHKR